MGSSPAPLKKPVSFRLSTCLLDRIDVYAAESGTSRTDAVEYFLNLGLCVGQETKAHEARLSCLEEELAEIKELLRRSLACREVSEETYRIVGQSVCEAAARFPAIRRAYLFGSFAKRTAMPDSDVDVRVEIDRAKRFNLRDLDQFAKAIERSIGRSVDVVSADEIKDEALARAVEESKVLIYERKA